MSLECNNAVTTPVLVSFTILSINVYDIFTSVGAELFNRRSNFFLSNNGIRWRNVLFSSIFVGFLSGKYYFKDVKVHISEIRVNGTNTATRFSTLASFQITKTVDIKKILKSQMKSIDLSVFVRLFVLQNSSVLVIYKLRIKKGTFSFLF